jgi:hypothetical protein
VSAPSRTCAALALAGALWPLAALADPFGPGEQHLLRVDYSGVTAGNAVITVGAATTVGTRSVWPIVTTADTTSVFSVFPLHDKFVSWWSPAAGRGIGYDFFANENGKTRRERCKLSSPEPGKAQVQRMKEGGPPSQSSYDVDPTAEDIASAFFFLRTQSLVPGADLSIPVFTGSHSWNMLAHVNPPEPLTVTAGAFTALPLDVDVHFQGKLESKRRLKVWVSDDARHVLLRIEAELMLGALHGELLEYHPGSGG